MAAAQNQLRRARLHFWLATRAVVDAKHRKEIRTVLDNDAMFNALADSLNSQYDAEARAHAGGTPFMDFLNWLISNGPAIIAMIVQIIALFAGKQSKAK